MVALDQPDEVVERLAATLDDGERERAAAFATGALRRRFTVAHGALRVLLGERLGLAPAAVTFAFGEHGKPAVDGVAFNLAHSGELALVALAEDDVGVDVERLRPIDEAVRLAERWLAPQDADRVAAAPEGERAETFLAAWTVREAYAKACGEGLSGGALAAHPPGFTAQPLRPRAGYVGAVAARGEGWTPRLREVAL